MLLFLKKKIEKIIKYNSSNLLIINPPMNLTSFFFSRFILCIVVVAVAVAVAL